MESKHHLDFCFILDSFCDNPDPKEVGIEFARYLFGYCKGYDGDFIESLKNIGITFACVNSMQDFLAVVDDLYEWSNIIVKEGENEIKLGTINYI